MIDGNISMEEDTELRDLVVQTLENNGVLAKVRAELRASIFLTLEEQESVLNPDPFLNKSVKQYLANAEGKLLFSLVREFLEYFGLDYTMSVYDPETYFGKEYNYAGRQKLCEELGIKSKEPLLGEILKNTINSALSNTLKNDSSEIILNRTKESIKNGANATFDISIPKVLLKESISYSDDRSDKSENICNSNFQNPVKVKILEENISCGKFNEYSIQQENEIDLNVNQDLIIAELQINTNHEGHKNNKVLKEVRVEKNTKNRKQIQSKDNVESQVYFDEVITDGIRQKIKGTRDRELLLDDLSPLPSENNSLFANLPPLNGKKANMNDLKELIDIAQGISQYDKDLASTVLCSIVEQQNPSNVHSTSDNLLNIHKNNQKSTNKIHNFQNENDGIIEEIAGSTSNLENILNQSIKNIALNTTSNHKEQNL